LNANWKKKIEFVLDEENLGMQIVSYAQLFQAISPQWST
jgi:hypothetical protein